MEKSLMFQKKKTKSAAYTVNIYNNRLLVLWRSKWEDEGTPIILPGGEINAEIETPAKGAVREFFEETGIKIDSDKLSILFEIKTQWTDRFIAFINNEPVEPTDLKLESEKFYGYIWIPLTDRKILNAIYPLCMSGLKEILKRLGVVDVY
jgi:8-oxo-dGTP pyrophosphatase MutT (NUDIX family)